MGGMVALHDDWERDEREAAFGAPVTPPSVIRNILDPPTPRHIAKLKVAKLREELERKGA